MGIIEKVKNCEGCRKRRKFLKEMFGGIAAGIGLTLLWPSLAKATCGECQCIICPSDGSWICLCCESAPCNCDACFFITSTNGITVCTPCPTGYKCFGTGCDGYCPPKVTCTDYKEGMIPDDMPKLKFSYYWEVTMSDGKKLMIGSDDSSDAVKQCNARVQYKDKNGKRILAISAKQFGKETA